MITFIRGTEQNRELVVPVADQESRVSDPTAGVFDDQEYMEAGVRFLSWACGPGPQVGFHPCRRLHLRQCWREGGFDGDWIQGVVVAVIPGAVIPGSCNDANGSRCGEPPGNVIDDHRRPPVRSGPPPCHELTDAWWPVRDLIIAELVPMLMA
ncbi:hypothetical protein AB0H12_44500 [Actinosynnema sp. NPDC023794]